jgi:hypothetical protein
MDIALGPVDVADWDLEERDILRHGDIAGLAWQDTAIAGIFDERREPSGFEVCAAMEEDIAAVESSDEAGSGIDEVGVFRSAGERLSFYVVSSDGFGNGGEVGQGTDDLDGGAMGFGGWEEGDEEGGNSEERMFFHGGSGWDLDLR